MKKPLIAGGVIFLGGIVLGFFSYLANMAPPDNLGLDILAANTVNVGEKVLFEVIIANRSGSQIIEDLSLTIRADDGTVFSDLPGSALMQKAIGDLESQAEFKELIPVIFWGKNHEQRKVEVTARYNFAGQQNSFEKVSIFFSALNLSSPCRSSRPSLILSFFPVISHIVMSREKNFLRAG
ncbi:MAG: hypothetical protein UU61_C0021G0004 [Parcubacteria group bacterium GW2011_GWB1_41_4]|nr:MAG: hypothetical protein UU61_C0021G0004 [Parcubacteria group bacterium GW2011_GWB1_41_4]